MKIQILLYLLFALFLAGCSGLPQRFDVVADDNNPLAICNQVYSLLEQAVSAAGVADAEAKRLPGFPYLRSNRFLASLAQQSPEPNYSNAWLDELISLDLQGRSVELANLPRKSKQNLDKQLANILNKNKTINQTLKDCASRFKTHDLDKPGILKKIIKSAKVEDDYSLFKRAIGLYPLTRYAVYQGFQQWKQKNLGSFSISDNKKKWSGKAIIYNPEINSRSQLNKKTIAHIIKQSRKPPLNIATLSKEEFTQLAEYFAPVFLIDEVNDADKIGKPFWSANQNVNVDHNNPVVFVRLSHTWFNDTILPQLVYTIWFSERQRQSDWDILSGKFDGVIWRVTIDEDGTPLIADSIHPCGCYHLFFPAEGIDNKPAQNKTLEEGITSPQNLPQSSSQNRLSIRLASNTHYVEALSNRKTINPAWENRSYKLIISQPIPDFELRSMPLPSGGRKSLYQQDGIVKGSERAERWLLWPMGIKNPGAMRQWGRHATAFVGRRHFDGPYLLDQSFIKKGK